MYIVFDLNDEKTKTRTEYTIDEASFIPRVGEIINLRNRKVEKSLNGEFKVESVEHEIMQTSLHPDQHVGEGIIEGIRVTANKVSQYSK